jgi:hypothetical protein
MTTKKKIYNIDPRPWTQSPFDLEGDGGVHRMPELTEENFSDFKFVFPNNLKELLLYISAVGGLRGGSAAEIPDLLLLENVEQLCSASSHSKLVSNLRRIFFFVTDVAAK